MAKEQGHVGTSFESFAAAAAAAFDTVPGDPKREGAASAEVARMWVSKGGFVGRVQYHVELLVRPVSEA